MSFLLALDDSGNDDVDLLGREQEVAWIEREQRESLSLDRTQGNDRVVRLAAGDAILGGLTEQVLVRSCLQSNHSGSLYKICLQKEQTVFRGKPVRRREAGEHGIGFYEGWGCGDHSFPSLKPLLNFAGCLAVMFMP